MKETSLKCVCLPWRPLSRFNGSNNIKVCNCTVFKQRRIWLQKCKFCLLKVQGHKDFAWDNSRFQHWNMEHGTVEHFFFNFFMAVYTTTVLPFISSFPGVSTMISIINLTVALNNLSELFVSHSHKQFKVL